MDLEKFDVVRVEALEAALDLVEDRLAREPGLVHVVARVLQSEILHGVEAQVVRHEDEALGQDRDAVARDVELDGSTSVSFGHARSIHRRTFLIAFPMRTSDSPLLYMLAVSHVLTKVRAMRIMLGDVSERLRTRFLASTRPPESAEPVEYDVGTIFLDRECPGKRTCSSSMTQGAHLLVPSDMAPRIGFETRKPLWPRRRYST
jgi:hypothetical protein